MKIRQLNLKEMKQLFDVIKNNESYPRKACIEGYLRNIIFYGLKYCIHVDKWPDFNLCVAKPAETNRENVPVYKVGIYCRNNQGINNIHPMLTQPKFLPENTTVRLHNLPIEYMPAVRKVSSTLGYHLKGVTNPRYCLVVKEMPEEVIQAITSHYTDKFYIDGLNPDLHTETIANNFTERNDYYETREEAIEATRYYITCGIALGVFEKPTNKLVAWILSNVDRAGFKGHTLHEYRGLRIAPWMTATMAYKCLKNGEPFVGYVAKDNSTSLKSMRKYEAFGKNIYYNQEFVFCTLRSGKSSKL